MSVSGDNGTAVSSISGSTVTISNLGGITAGTTIKVTVTSAATTNYKAATATYTLTINKATKYFTWIANGHTLSVPSGCSKVNSTNTSDVTCSCTYGDANGCTVSTPTISSPDPGYKITNATFNGATAISEGDRKASFVYNGGTTEGSCTATNVGACNISLSNLSIVTSSKYNNYMTYVGLATSANSTSYSTYSTVAPGATYYAVYKTGNQKIYYKTSSGVTSTTGNFYEAYATSTGSTSYTASNCSVTSDMSSFGSYFESNPPTGYVSIGFATSVNDSNYLKDYSKVCQTANTLYAVYLKPITITFVKQTGIKTIKGSSDSSVTESHYAPYLYQSSGSYSQKSVTVNYPSVTVEDGYTFTGWGGASSGGVETGSSFNTSNNATRYAVAKDEQKPQISLSGFGWSGSVSSGRLMWSYGNSYTGTMEIKITDNSSVVNLVKTPCSNIQYYIGNQAISASSCTTSGTSPRYIKVTTVSANHTLWGYHRGDYLKLYIPEGVYSDGTNKNSATYIYAAPVGSTSGSSYYKVY